MKLFLSAIWHNSTQKVLEIVVFQEVLQKVRVDIVLHEMPGTARALFHPHLPTSWCFQHIRPTGIGVKKRYLLTSHNS